MYDSKDWVCVVRRRYPGGRCLGLKRLSKDECVGCWLCMEACANDTHVSFQPACLRRLPGADLGLALERLQAVAAASHGGSSGGAVISVEAPLEVCMGLFDTCVSVVLPCVVCLES
jgi:hypothetical protein